MSHRRQHARVRSTDDKLGTLRRRARKLVKRGDYRKAARMIREVVALGGEARSWVRLGHLLTHGKRDDQALDALKQGLYLYRREGADGRARTVAQMILRLDPSEPCACRVLAA